MVAAALLRQPCLVVCQPSAQPSGLGCAITQAKQQVPLASTHKATSISRSTSQLHVFSVDEDTGSVAIPFVNEKGIVVNTADATPFEKILCANRGEIAVRVFRAGTELGLRTLAVYSAADRLQPHRYKADESYQVGQVGATPVACYLDGDGIVALAKAQGVDVIHPGYGFLAENANFARKCEEHGIAFIGPRPETIEAMGDKTLARALAEECQVACVPGSKHATDTAEDAIRFVKDFGLPVILKAAMGGGGRGMRVVRSEDELQDAFERASAEAKAAFGDGRMFIEKYVEDPRHIEVQILADGQGGVVHLHERDCSVQRRHQKVVEMAPAIGLSDAVRQKLHADAVKLARHVNYRNAGTVEFMLDSAGDHYFLEVNPRIQVEHTVTEEITGIDLVQSQIRIAGGATLADLGIHGQEDVQQPYGVAIQCRVTSEDPERNFSPDGGRITAYRSPGGPGIRLDGAMAAGNVVSRHYDSLLVKVITHANTFTSAVQKMQRALVEFHIRGVKTNIPFLENVLRHPEFLAGDATTSFIERNPQLFSFGTRDGLQASKLLGYLAELVVNGPKHPGAVGAPPARITPPPPELPAGSPTSPPPGWRQIFLEQGADGWAKAVRAHSSILITDTTWRDAHQSLLATRVRTHDLCVAAPATSIALAPAASLEMWGGATFDVALRFLHECPWKRLERLRALIPNIPFQMLLRGANAVGYTSYPDNVVKGFVHEAKAAGVDIFRVFDSLNYVDNLLFGLDTVHAAGGIAEGAICYTGDITNPSKTKYNLEYYLKMADQLVAHGVHALAIKDMAGLMKPQAATMLVSALRQAFPHVPIHVHTHDTAGTGVATQLAAAAAGADILDAAIDSMSGTTSQPCMGAIVHALAGTQHDTGLDTASLSAISSFWEHTRALYAPFESDMKSPSTDVYQHEMPGGQYTNLKFQASSLGLGERWEKVKKAYAAANRVLGDIVKVTPSSKVAGDLAQFMVQNSLTEESVNEQAGSLNFPDSVMEFLQGKLGQPGGGFPEPFRSRVVKDKPVIEGRPGQDMPPLNLKRMASDLRDKYEWRLLSHRDVLSAALYPKVFDGYMEWGDTYSRFTEQLPTRSFWAPLEEDEEIEVELSQGNTVSVKYKALSELQPNGVREVFFEINGIPRVVEVVDKTEADGAAAANVGKKAARERADPSKVGSVAAPMAGEVVDVQVIPGATIRAGQALVILSAMKMETSVAAPCEGVVQHVAIEKGDSIDAGDLVVLIRAGGEDANASSMSVLASVDGR